MVRAHAISIVEDEMPPVLLLAGGLGTRLKPLTDHLPKCLVPIAGRPLLAYWNQTFERQGFGDIVINVHAHPEQVMAWLEAHNAEAGPVAWEAFAEEALLGSAGTLRANLERLEGGRDFLIVYADNLSEVDLAGLMASHRERESDFTMALFEAPNPSACGIATLEADGRISDFVEKPERPISNLANAGIYAVRSGVLGEFLENDEFDIGHDLLPRLVGRMHGWRIEGYHRDVGSTESLAAIERDMAAGRVPLLQKELLDEALPHETPLHETAGLGDGARRGTKSSREEGKRRMEEQG